MNSLQQAYLAGYLQKAANCGPDCDTNCSKSPTIVAARAPNAEQEVADSLEEDQGYISQDHTPSQRRENILTERLEKAAQDETTRSSQSSNKEGLLAALIKHLSSGVSVGKNTRVEPQGVGLKVERRF